MGTFSPVRTKHALAPGAACAQGAGTRPPEPGGSASVFMLDPDGEAPAGGGGGGRRGQGRGGARRARPGCGGARPWVRAEENVGAGRQGRCASRRPRRRFIHKFRVWRQHRAAAGRGPRSRPAIGGRQQSPSNRLQVTRGRLATGARRCPFKGWPRGPRAEGRGRAGGRSGAGPGRGAGGGRVAAGRRRRGRSRAALPARAPESCPRPREDHGRDRGRTAAPP